jgi:hypothetical protein
MELRFGCSHTASEECRNFLVLVPFDIMQNEHRAIPGGELSNGLIQCNAIEDGHGLRVFGPLLHNMAHVSFLGGFLKPRTTPSEMHQYLIDRQPMKPGGKSRFPTEGPNLTIKLNEDLLCHIFRIGGIAQHPVAQRINPPSVYLIELLKSLNIACR